LNAHQTGYKRGKSEGYAEGFEKGYDKGYRKGIKDEVEKVERLFNFEMDVYASIVDWFINKEILTPEQKENLDKAYNNGEVSKFLGKPRVRII
jgi:hypothetical protein